MRPIGKGVPDRSSSNESGSYEENRLLTFFALGVSIVVTKSGMGPASATLALVVTVIGPGSCNP